MTEEEYREKNKAACAARYQKNKERYKAYARDYYQAHKEEINMKAKLHRMGLLQRRDKRGSPCKGEESKADEIKKLDIAVYEQRLAENKAIAKQNVALRRLQRMAEELRQAGYTVIEKENEDE